MRVMSTSQAEKAGRRRDTRAKGQRLEARVSAEQKALLQRAANLQGRTLTEFLVSSAQAEAERVVEQHDVIVLSLRDSQHFAALVLDPPPPNSRLRAAMRRHMAEVEDEDIEDIEARD